MELQSRIEHYWNNKVINITINCETNTVVDCDKIKNFRYCIWSRQDSFTLFGQQYVDKVYEFFIE